MLRNPLRELEGWASEANLKSRVLHIPNSNEQLYPPMRHSGMGGHTCPEGGMGAFLEFCISF